MRLITGDTPPLRIWRNAPATPLGVPPVVLDKTTGAPLASADLTTLTGKLAVLPAGSNPSGADDAAFKAFTWAKWQDGFGEVADVATINVGPNGDVDWPADATSVTVWWQVTDGAGKTFGGQAPGSIELYG